MEIYIKLTQMLVFSEIFPIILTVLKQGYCYNVLKYKIKNSEKINNSVTKP